jgi:hypothetical protein
MDDLQFDRIARTVAGLTSRRGLLGIVASLPVVGGVLVDDASAKRRQKRDRKDDRDQVEDEKRKKKKKKVTLCLNGQTIKVAKSKKKNFLNQGATAGACPSCVPEAKTTTCAGKCGNVTNNCGTVVDCGSCDCEPPCGECFKCEGTPGQCVPEDPFTTPCGTGPSCSNGFAVPGDYCDGTGICVSPSPFPCQPYLCAGDTCGNTCTDDNDCEAWPAFCNAQNECSYKLPLGSTCDGDSDCISNACCGGACQECCANSDCTGGNVCGANFTCIPSCTSSSCSADKLCINELCLACDVVDGMNLQTAIEAADAGATLLVCAGTYPGDGGQVDIDKDLTIIGAGDGGNGTFVSDRIRVSAPDPQNLPTVTLTDIRVKGQATGVVLVDANLTMNNCTVFESTKGVTNTRGTLVMNDCSILDNIVSFNSDGAGLTNINGFATLNGCLIQGNQAPNGAGILTGSNPSTTESKLVLDSGTIVRGNTATAATTPNGAGILNFNSTSSVTISQDSAVCENTPVGTQCSGFPQGRCLTTCPA